MRMMWLERQLAIVSFISHNTQQCLQINYLTKVCWVRS